MCRVIEFRAGKRYDDAVVDGMVFTPWFDLESKNRTDSWGIYKWAYGKWKEAVKERLETKGVRCRVRYYR